MTSPGKIFEQDFQKSCPENVYIYRFKDNAASFAQGSNTRFTSHNMCDYLLFDNSSRTLYFLELKSTKSTSIPVTMIRETQIKELTEASANNVIAGFVVNFREKDNYTAFISIQDFNKMMSEINKKSFNINDLQKYNATEIQSKQKRVRYTYDLENFISKTKITD